MQSTPEDDAPVNTAGTSCADWLRPGARCIYDHSETHFQDRGGRSARVLLELLDLLGLLELDDAGAGAGASSSSSPPRL